VTESKRAVIDEIARDSTEPLVSAVGRKAAKRAADQTPLTNVSDTRKVSAQFPNMQTMNESSV